MKVIFIRHGEAMDDVENRYGGWADFELSEKGVKGAKEVASKLKEKNLTVELILSSPLKRTVQTAQEIGKILGLPLETFVYLKERNTYGLLCGENKDEAKNKYPELVEAYEAGEEVLGYESYQFFLKRVKTAIGKIIGLGKESVICVTHGKFLGALFKDILQIEVREFKDNCIAEVEVATDGKLSLIRAVGIELK